MGGVVLLADDSVVVRKFVAAELRREPMIEEVITAPNGRLALAKLERSNPDLVILDVEMPEMGGLEALREFKVRAPDVPVVMFSGLTERAGELTLDALSLGAADYVAKPSQIGSGASDVEGVCTELRAKVTALLEKRFKALGREQGYNLTSRPPRLSSHAPASREIELVVIGASTGGPTAISELLPRLPADFPVPVLVAQHMPPLFTRLFAERLDSLCKLKVREATRRAILEPGNVWIAQGDHHLAVERRDERLVSVIHQGPREQACRPAVDVLFRSAAEACQGGVIAVLLTGMGVDGLSGCKRIASFGGSVLVQDKSSSTVWGMAGSVAKAGIANEILPIEQIAPAIQRHIQLSKRQRERRSLRVES